jgi:hypothetical protein
VITVEKVDFLGIPVRENATGDAWFGETLGLWERNPRSNERWVEYEASNVTLALVPDAYTPGDFVPLPFGALAIRVDDVDAERERLSAAGVELQARSGTRASATALRSRGSTATGSSSTGATRRSRTAAPRRP